MPASRKSHPKSSRTARAHPATPGQTGPASADAAPGDETAPDTGTTAAGSAEPVEEAPLNRAARRAKGGAASQQQGYGPGKVSGGKGPVANHRMWANRRSG